MSEPHPTIYQTNGTHVDVELTAVPDTAELSRALRGIIMAGKAIEDAMSVPIEQRQIITKEIRRQLDKTPHLP